MERNMVIINISIKKMKEKERGKTEKKKVIYTYKEIEIC